MPLAKAAAGGRLLTQQPTTLDPVEQIEQGIERLNADVASQLLKRLREQDPAFLEQSVLHRVPTLQS